MSGHKIVSITVYYVWHSDGCRRTTCQEDNTKILKERPPK